MSGIIVIPAAEDNYIYLITDGTNAAVVDPLLAEPVMRVVQERGLGLELILLTHGHADHTGGVQELKERYGSRVIGPDKEIALVDDVPADNAAISVGTRTVHVLTTPGHTPNAFSFYLLPDEQDPAGAVFTGDTMFIGGCGRLFGGEPETLFNSLKKLADLPDDTAVYPGHEYALENYKFAVEVAPADEAVYARYQEVQALFRRTHSTVPSTIAKEWATNVFLRAQNVQVFAELRRRKDVF